MKEIPLTQGKIALVDDEDYERVRRYVWYACLNRDTWYAKTTIVRKGKRRWLGMHGVVMRFHPTKLSKYRIDHADRNGLNNQKYNLRYCTESLNCMNRGLASNNTTGFKGVSWDRHHHCFKVMIEANGRKFYLGNFKDPKEGALAWNAAALQHHGQFAYQNRI